MKDLFMGLGGKMGCIKCGAELPDGAVFCHLCGKKQGAVKSVKRRGNGQGCVYQLPNGKWKAVVILDYRVDEDGGTHRKTRSRVFTKKKDAVNALASLRAESQKKERAITFKQLYDRWLPTHRAGRSTIDCYKAAVKHFSAIWHDQISEVDVDDLQECIDNSGTGKRTQQNMRTTCGLMYKYGIPRHLIPHGLNLAEYLSVGGEGAAHRPSFTEEEIEKIRKAAGTVPYADYIYCWIYLGFRPSEALDLTVESYDAENRCFTGGAKTEAGKNRTVTISPKILRHIEKIIGTRKTGFVFCDENGNRPSLKKYSESYFYPALEQIGIDNPMVKVGGGTERHKYTPHSCRHTFSTLMKRVDAPTKDKLELIGHTSDEMLRYYQDVALDDLRKVTDAL